MFTSRAEFRLLLREDNADRRLTPIGRDLGLVTDTSWARFTARRDRIETIVATLVETSVGPSATNRALVADAGLGTLDKKVQADALLGRRDARLHQLARIVPSLALDTLCDEDAEAVEIECRYRGYLDRQREQAAKLRDTERVRVPADLDYDAIGGLSNEVREKLTTVRPATLGQASRISGVTPAAITNLWIAIERHHAVARAAAESETGAPA